jgi:hypothetical protein
MFPKKPGTGRFNPGMLKLHNKHPGMMLGLPRSACMNAATVTRPT